MALWRYDGDRLIPGTLRNLAGGIVDAYLACPGPSLQQVSDRDLRRPGAMVCALNTAYPHIKPDIWIGGDLPECYDDRLYFEPFVKVSPVQYMTAQARPGRTVRQCPNVWFYQSKRFDDPDKPTDMFSDDRFGTDENELVWARSTLWTAIDLICRMRPRRIILVGADFGGSRDYHDDRELADHLRIANRRLMDRQVDDLALVAARAADRGIEIVSATAGSAANGVVEYIELARVARQTTMELPARTGRDPVHAYLAEYSHWTDPDRIMYPEGVLTGADAHTEWMIPWFYQNVMAHNPGMPIAFADFGMTDDMRSRCAVDGIQVVDVGKKTRLSGWHNKPTAICMSPFAKTIWLDTDVEVKGDLSPLFAIDGVALAADGHCAGDRGDRPVNTGVVVADNGNRTIVEWARAILAEPLKYRGDQDALNGLVADGLVECPGAIPKRFNWLRLDGAPPADAVCIHYTGPIGHRRVAELAGLAVDNFRGRAIADRLDALFGHAPLRGAEIGVLAGRTSRHLLAARENLTLYMVDLWAPPAPGSDYVESGDDNAVRPAEAFDADYRLAESATRFADDRRELIQADSVEAAGRFDDGELDFVFIDGDHSLAGVTADLAAWFPKVRPGGLVCGHDIDNEAFPGFQVRAALEQFLTDRGMDPDMEVEVDRDYTWFVVKPGAEPGDVGPTEPMVAVGGRTEQRDLQ